MATAAATAALGIDPFDQPNVSESKKNTQNLLNEYLSAGKLPEGERVLATDKAALTAAVTTLLNQVAAGDYVAIMSYTPGTPAIDKALQAMRVTLRDRLKVATTLGYGPRFLHSTGQLHKGGANHGVFIQLTADAVNDLPIEGQAYSFGTLIRAQALGDLKALSGRGYRVMRIHLGQNVVAGLKSTQAALDAALGVKKPAPRKPVTKATKKAAR
jgi:hypothetical protein